MYNVYVHVQCEYNDMIYRFYMEKCMHMHMCTHTHTHTVVSLPALSLASSSGVRREWCAVVGSRGNKLGIVATGGGWGRRRGASGR